MTREEIEDFVRKAILEDVFAGENGQVEDDTVRRIADRWEQDTTADEFEEVVEDYDPNKAREALLRLSERGRRRMQDEADNFDKHGVSGYEL